MRFVVLLLVLFLTTFSFTQVLKNSNSGNYFIAKSADTTSKKTLVFFHGKWDEIKEPFDNRIVPLDSLLEMNTQLIKSFNDAGYHCVFPLALHGIKMTHPRMESFLKEILTKENIQSKEVVLSGFSEGATAAFQFFYKHPEAYKSLLVFNAYPQQDAFAKSLDFRKVENKKIILVGQEEDKIIPYEFSLMAYRRQKMFNHETYYMLRPGKHEFSQYAKKDFEQLLQILNAPIKVKTNSGEFTWIYPAVDGLIIDQNLIEVYPFRKSIGKKFDIDINEYMGQQESYEMFKAKLNKKEAVQLLPVFIYTKELQTKQTFELSFLADNDHAQKQSFVYIMDNYFLFQNW